MLESLSSSTRKQYDTAIRLWWTYCLDNKLPCYNASIPQMIFFKLLNESYLTNKYGSFNNGFSFNFTKLVVDVFRIALPKQESFISRFK